MGPKPENSWTLEEEPPWWRRRWRWCWLVQQQAARNALMKPAPEDGGPLVFWLSHGSQSQWPAEGTWHALSIWVECPDLVTKNTGQPVKLQIKKKQVKSSVLERPMQDVLCVICSVSYLATLCLRDFPFQVLGLEHKQMLACSENWGWVVELAVHLDSRSPYG